MKNQMAIVVYDALDFMLRFDGQMQACPLFAVIESID